MIEEEWVMYGYHKSTSSAKFYVEGAAIAKTITALNKRIKARNYFFTLRIIIFKLLTNHSYGV